MIPITRACIESMIVFSAISGVASYFIFTEIKPIYRISIGMAAGAYVGLCAYAHTEFVSNLPSP